MTDRTRFCLLAAAMASLAIGAGAAAAEPTNAELMAEVQALREKVQKLETSQPQNSQDLAAVIDGVLRDAERRSQLLAAGGAGAGHDERGFWLGNENFMLRPGFGMQFVNVTNFSDDRKRGTDDDTQNGFELTRTRLTAEGHAFSPDLQYFFQWASDIDGDMTLLDAYAVWWFNDDWGLLMGQFKCPIHHEGLVLWNEQLLASRSLVNQLIGTPDVGAGSRFQGVGLLYGRGDDALHAKIAFHDGAGAANTDFTDGPQYFGVTGRADYVIMGRRADYNDFTAKGTKEDLLVVGGGFDWTQAENTDGIAASVDAQWENTGGLGVYGAVLLSHNDPRNVDPDEETTNWGGLVQAGYMLNDQWELFGRADVTVFDEDALDDEDTFWEFAVGFNYYLGRNGSAGNRAKFTVEAKWLPDGTPADVRPLDYLHFIGGSEEDEIVLTAQFVLVI